MLLMVIPSPYAPQIGQEEMLLRLRMLAAQGALAEAGHHFIGRALLPFAEEVVFVLFFSPVGFKWNLSLLEQYVCFSSRGLQQIKV